MKYKGHTDEGAPLSKFWIGAIVVTILALIAIVLTVFSGCAAGQVVGTEPSSMPGMEWALIDDDDNGTADRKEMRPLPIVADTAEAATGWAPSPWDNILGGAIAAATLALGYATRKPVIAVAKKAAGLVANPLKSKPRKTGKKK